LRKTTGRKGATTEPDQKAQVEEGSQVRGKRTMAKEERPYKKPLTGRKKEKARAKNLKGSGGS